MQNATAAIRNIIFKHGGSLTQTLTLTAKPKADITSAIYEPSLVYAKQPLKRKEVLDDVFKYAKICGADKHGADTAIIHGAAHKGGKGNDTFERVTVTMKDKNGNQMHFYRKSDGAFCERIHVPISSAKENAGLWKITDDYIQITKEEFEAKELNKK